MSTWLVTGSSRGFGMLICRHALAKGHRVVATARNVDGLKGLAAEYPDAVLPIALDVTDSDAVDRAVAQAVAWSPTIDVLINNAGYGVHGAIEEVSEKETAQIFDTNVFGVLRVTRAVLPVMRKQRSGHIINLGSIAGLLARGGTGMYGATKFAIEGISEALKEELTPLGIKVTVIEPGKFRTNFNSESIKIAETQIADYATTVGKRLAQVRASVSKQPGDPERVAAIILDIAGMAEPPLHLVLGDEAVDLFQAKLAALNAEVKSWEKVSRSTYFDN